MYYKMYNRIGTVYPKVPHLIIVYSVLLNASGQPHNCLFVGVNQARQTRPNSGGVAEGQPRLDKGGVAIFFYFLRVKNRTF